MSPIPAFCGCCKKRRRSEGITVQYKAPGIGGTDAGAIHLAQDGIPAITVATPCRYIHGPAAILNLNDLSASVRLVEAALQRLTPDDLTSAL